MREKGRSTSHDSATVTSRREVRGKTEASTRGVDDLAALSVAVSVAGSGFVPTRGVADAVDPDVHVDLAFGLEHPDACWGGDLEGILCVLIIRVDLTDRDVANVQVNDPCWRLILFFFFFFFFFC